MSLRMAIETLASTRAQHKNPELLRFIRDENRNLAELLKLPERQEGISRKDTGAVRDLDLEKNAKNNKSSVVADAVFSDRFD